MDSRTLGKARNVKYMMKNSQQKSDTKIFGGIFLLVFVIALIGCASSGRTGIGSPEIFVRAQGVGSTPSSALNDAFRDAIQRSAGVVINSQMVMQDGRITQDLMQEYSGAFITSYEITRQRQISSGYSVDIAANVSSTRLANRLLELSKRGSASKPNTSQFYAQVSTLLKSRAQGDAFLANILSEYPDGALKVSVGAPSPRVTDYRNVYLDIPVEVSWSKTYLDALKETVGFLAINSCRAYVSPNLPCQYDVAFASEGVLGFGALRGYKLTDGQQASIVFNRLRPQVVIVVNLYGNGDQLLMRKCLAYDMSKNMPDPRPGRGSIPIQLMTVFRGVEIIDQPYHGFWPLGFRNPEDMKSIQRIDAEVMATCPAGAQI